MIQNNPWIETSSVLTTDRLTAFTSCKEMWRCSARLPCLPSTFCLATTRYYSCQAVTEGSSILRTPPRCCARCPRPSTPARCSRPTRWCRCSLWRVFHSSFSYHFFAQVGQGDGTRVLQSCKCSTWHRPFNAAATTEAEKELLEEELVDEVPEDALEEEQNAEPRDTN